jgi:hypothetical protein
MFDRRAYEPGQVAYIQLGHQVGAVICYGFRADRPSGYAA